LRSHIKKKQKVHILIEAQKTAKFQKESNNSLLGTLVMTSSFPTQSYSVLLSGINLCSEFGIVGFGIEHENGLILGRSDFRFSIIMDFLYNFFHTISDISAYSVLIVINNLKKYRVSKK
jgi:hypothetical protein